VIVPPDESVELDAAEVLRTKHDCAVYLLAILRECPHDAAAFERAVATVNRAHARWDLPRSKLPTFDRAGCLTGADDELTPDA
jgi:hypothetical protein